MIQLSTGCACGCCCALCAVVLAHISRYRTHVPHSVMYCVVHLSMFQALGLLSPALTCASWWFLVLGPGRHQGQEAMLGSACADLSCQLEMHAFPLCVCTCHLQQRTHPFILSSPYLPSALLALFPLPMPAVSWLSTHTYTLMSRWVLSCLYHHLMCRPSPSVLRDLSTPCLLCWWWWHKRCVAQSLGPLCMLESSRACGCGCRQSADAAQQRTTLSPALFDSIGRLPDWLDACTPHLLCKTVSPLLQAAG